MQAGKIWCVNEAALVDSHANVTNKVWLCS